MAHDKQKYSNLYKPASISEKVDPQKMFYDNMVQEENNYLSLIKRIAGSVGSVTELKTVVTSDTALYVDGLIILVRGIAMYYFNATSSATTDDNKIVAPTTGTGRWIRIDSASVDHIGNTTVHITSSERTAWNNKVDKNGSKVLTDVNFTAAYETKLGGISVDADKVEGSATNGNIKINGTETPVYVHPFGTNPHGTTKADVGLSDVPNVSTNNQKPTYSAATDDTPMSSGEIMATAFGKIARFVSQFITHKGDTTLHITSSERTAWNGASASNHSHGNKSILDAITAAFTTAYKSKLDGIADGANNYVHPNTHPWSMITDAPTSYPANGGDANSVDGQHFNWDGHGGQPAWLWGANSNGESYLYNPSNFDVNALGGRSSSGYMQVTNRVDDSVDINTLLTAGCYGVGANNPHLPGGNYGTLLVLPNADTGLQIYGGYVNDEYYMRGWSNNGATWTVWRKLYTSREIMFATSAPSSLIDGAICYVHE
jgi:hypothetical protein